MITHVFIVIRNARDSSEGYLEVSKKFQLKLKIHQKV